MKIKLTRSLGATDWRQQLGDNVGDFVEGSEHDVAPAEGEAIEKAGLCDVLERDPPPAPAPVAKTTAPSKKATPSQPDPKAVKGKTDG